MTMTPITEEISTPKLLNPHLRYSIVLLVQFNNLTTRFFLYIERFQDESVCLLCQNGGRCKDPSNEYCDCPSGFVGTYCETRSSHSSPTEKTVYAPCDVQPCQRNGTCRPLRNGIYKCDCPLGTGGFNCQNRK